MTFSLRPAIRENTPLIVGIGGPTKSGKTFSAHRIAQGLANGGTVAMLNAEGQRGHQYADKFKYLACDIEPPFSYERYQEAVLEIAKQKPAVLIVDSMSHAHDGPGGMLEQHDAEVDRMAGNDWKKRERVNFAGWIRPKKAENAFIYTLLGLKCPIVLCFRAKEKLKIVPGKEPVNLGWQPISSDRIAFETIFTVMLPPHSKGVPDLSISEMRDPFESFIKPGQPIDESLGKRLAEWAKGSTAAPQGGSAPLATSSLPVGAAGSLIDAEALAELRAEFAKCDAGAEKAFLRVTAKLYGTALDGLDKLPASDFGDALEWVKARQVTAGAT